jgi:hypothetical protein
MDYVNRTGGVMLRSLAVGLSLLVLDGIHADPPAAKVVPPPSPKPATNQVVRADGTPVVVQQAQTPAPVIVRTIPGPATQPCPCEQTVRPGRAWLPGCRPILIDDHFRYEPRIRDIRYSMPSSTLPGTGLGAPDTLFVLPPYQARDGYFRIFDRR